MSVRCATCSEDFLGAVNRCWKCGSTVTLNLQDFKTPPVRRAPVTLRPRAAAASAPSSTGGGIATAELAEADVALQNSPPRTATAKATGARRRGNPFAGEATHAVFVPAASETLANQNAAEKGVWIGLGVSLLAWLMAFFFPPAALVIAIVAMGLAIWGLSSGKKALAGAVLALCVLGFLVSGYQSARWAYDLIAPEFSIPEVDEDNL